MHVDEEEEGEEKKRKREAAGARREARKEQRIRSIVHIVRGIGEEGSDDRGGRLHG